MRSETSRKMSDNRRNSTTTTGKTFPLNTHVKKVPPKCTASKKIKKQTGTVIAPQTRQTATAVTCSQRRDKRNWQLEGCNDKLVRAWVNRAEKKLREKWERQQKKTQIVSSKYPPEQQKDKCAASWGDGSRIIWVIRVPRGLFFQFELLGHEKPDGRITGGTHLSNEHATYPSHWYLSDIITRTSSLLRMVHFLLIHFPLNINPCPSFQPQHQTLSSPWGSKLSEKKNPSSGA